MGKGFRQADVRRLEEIFNHDLPAPYSAEGGLANKYQCLQMRVMDPEALELVVCNVSFDYDPEQKKGHQPLDKEVELIANTFVALCKEYELTRDERANDAHKLKLLHVQRVKARADAIAEKPEAAPEAEPEVTVETLWHQRNEPKEEKTEMEA